VKKITRKRKIMIAAITLSTIIIFVVGSHVASRISEYAAAEIRYAHDIYLQALSSLYITELSADTQSAVDISFTRRWVYPHEDDGHILGAFGEAGLFVEGSVRRIIEGYDVKISAFSDNSALEGGTYERSYFVIDGDEVLYFSVIDGVQTVINDMTNWTDYHDNLLDPISIRNSHFPPIPDFDIEDVHSVSRNINRVRFGGGGVVENKSLTLGVTMPYERRTDDGWNITMSYTIRIELDHEDMPQRMTFTKNELRERGIIARVNVSRILEITTITFNGFDNYVDIILPEAANQLINTN